MAQTLSVGEDQPVPKLDSREADILGGIPNTDIDRIYKDRIDRGILIPEQGIEDIFMTKGSKETLDLEKYGFICIEPTVGNIVVSRDPPSDPNKPRKSRTIEGTTEGTTMLILTERAPGQTDCKSEQRGRLLKVFRVTVTTKDLMQTLMELRALIGGLEGIKLRIVGEKIIVDGELIVPSEIERFVKVMNKFQADKNAPTMLNLVQVSPLSQEYLAKKMEEQIAGGPDRPRDIRVKVINGRFFLEGSVDRESQREEALKICKSFLQPSLAVEKTGVTLPSFAGNDRTNPVECNNLIWRRQQPAPDPDDIIVVRVDFVNLNRNYLKSFDFNWNPAILPNPQTGQSGDQVTYNSDAGKFLSSFTGTISGLFPKLNHAHEHGYGRILKTVTLLSKDYPNATDRDQPPEQTVAESFNIPVLDTSVDRNGNAVQVNNSQKIETTVKIRTASIKGSDKIRLGVNASNTIIRGAATSSGEVPTLTDQVNTTILVSSGESAALAGIITETRTVTYKRDPAVAGGVNIFDISRNQSFADDKSQFIVFVTPTKQKTPSPGTEELKRKFRLKR